MSRKAIRLVIVLATVSLVGISIIQIYWVKKAFDLREKEFNHSIHLALTNVVEEVCMCNDVHYHDPNPINQLSSSYYTVRVDDFIDPAQLEASLKTEFIRKDVITDFEYGIYDCNSEEMVYGSYVDMDAKSQNDQPVNELPRLVDDDYYFGVYFPYRTSHLISGMDIWIFSSVVLLIVIIFFAYTMVVILRQKRLSEVQKDFVNNMTHEFKTPISTINISSEVLKNPEIVNDPERLVSYATIIQEESQRLKRQVERVLQMATTEKGRIELKKELVDINDVINTAISNVNSSLQEKKGEVNCELESEEPVINADRLHLTNVIYNLLDNAVKYCRKVPKIRITTRKDGNGILIEMKDNGIGIRSDEQNRIFQKFYRVPTGNVHDVKGFGLGLNYVKTIVEAHHGNIRLKSEPDQGSLFRIFLPYNQ